jgi:hypothetical protein
VRAHLMRSFLIGRRSFWQELCRQFDVAAAWARVLRGDPDLRPGLFGSVLFNVAQRFAPPGTRSDFSPGRVLSVGPLLVCSAAATSTSILLGIPTSGFEARSFPCASLLRAAILRR